jgi:hypothetical protein
MRVFMGGPQEMKPASRRRIRFGWRDARTRDLTPAEQKAKQAGGAIHPGQARRYMPST